jgi:hypothetical protein
MHRTIRARILATLALLSIVAIGIAPASVRAADEPAGWDGSVDLYRDGVFTTQATWLWCTAAGVQIVRNIVHEESDHTRAGQRRYFDWMRDHNRYDLPESAGVDPEGWAAGLRAFIDDRYRLVASRSFDAALRSAVANLRRTGLPVAVTVSNGGHGWILTGFEATADPLATDDYTVTSVRVVGPLYGRQSRNGYDMPPDTELSVARFRGFFTPWRYAPMSMIWDGRYVSIQPVVPEVAVPAPTPAIGGRRELVVRFATTRRMHMAVYGELRAAIP